MTLNTLLVTTEVHQFYSCFLSSQMQSIHLLIIFNYNLITKNSLCMISLHGIKALSAVLFEQGTKAGNRNAFVQCFLNVHKILFRQPYSFFSSAFDEIIQIITHLFCVHLVNRWFNESSYKAATESYINQSKSISYWKSRAIFLLSYYIESMNVATQ